VDGRTQPAAYRQLRSAAGVSADARD